MRDRHSEPCAGMCLFMEQILTEHLLCVRRVDKAAYDTHTNPHPYEASLLAGETEQQKTELEDTVDGGLDVINTQQQNPAGSSGAGGRCGAGAGVSRG